MTINLNDGFALKSSSQFERRRKTLPQDVLKALDSKLKFFSTDAYYPSLNTKCLRVSGKTLKDLEVDSVWEFYVNRKEYRCIFYVRENEKLIILADIGNHDQIRRRYGRN